MALTKIGATLGGSADIISVTQTSHGFVSNDRGKAVRMNNNSGTPQYVLARANTTANADALGIIVHVTDGNTFTLALSGRITVDNCVPNEVAGTVLFLPINVTGGGAMGTSNSGHLTSTEPSGNNEVSKPMAVITIANSEMIMVQQRGEVISTAGISIADGSIDNDAMADNAINTDEIQNDAVTYAKMQDTVANNKVLGAATAGTIGEVSIETAMIAANAVDLAAMQHGTQGDVLYYGASGVPTRLGFGTSGHFLKTQGTGANPVWAAAGGGALTFVATQLITSGTSDFTMTGLDTTYDTFLIVGSEIRAATNGAQMFMRVGSASGGIDGSSTNYSWSIEYLQSTTTSHTAYNNNSHSVYNLINNVSSTHDGGFHLWMYRNGGSSNAKPTFSGSSVTYTGSTIAGGTIVAGYKAALDLDRIFFTMSSGQIAYGRFTVWGLKHA